MELCCPACGASLTASAGGGPTVVECAACSRRVEIDEDGVTSTLPLAASSVAETLDGKRANANVAATIDHVSDARGRAAAHKRSDELADATLDRVEDTVSFAGRREGEPLPRRDFGPGQRFGDYEILAEIARGGMGVVFKARQVKLNRVVALKMILGGQLAREDQIARFYAEAQAAAHLDHPGIVPVYEVGEVEGQHFFSMGFVEGASLGDRLTAGPLPPREAADLIHKTARAVAYAHAQGVIHRDLKPSNVLVDAAGQPRVTDFGLAKSVSGGEPGKELTIAGAIIGTPSYMPPEQAWGRTSEIGALADVYSLGATLYCLLVGRPPFQSASVTDTLRQVIEREPVSPRRLNAAVDRDLETICLKCLEKEPARRFASASALADDLQRYLEKRPIVARPISRPARLLRWCRRNPRVAMLAGAFLFVLIGGAAVSTYFAIEATNNAEFFRAEKIRADDEAQKATANAEFFRLEKVRADGETAKAVSALERETEALKKQAAALTETEESIYKYVQTIKSAELLKDARFRPLLKELLAEAAAHYERYIERHKDDRDTAARAKLAAALLEVAGINTFRGTTDAAFAAFEQVLPIQEQLVRDNPGVASHEAELARTHHNQGVLFQMTGRSPEALTAYETARGARERLAKENPTNDAYQYDLFSTLNNIGGLHYESSRPAEALTAYNQAIKVQERLAAARPNVVKYQEKLSAGYVNVGTVYLDTNRLDEALASFKQALGIQERLAKENPLNTDVLIRLGGCHQSLGNLYAAMEKPAEALAAYQKALDIRERVALSNPTVDQYQSDVASSLNCVGLEHELAGNLSEAKTCYEKALAIAERLARENPAIVNYQVDMAGMYVNLSNRKRGGDPQGAMADNEKAISILEAVLKRELTNLSARTYLRNAFMGRADLHEAAGRHAHAADDWQRALDTDKGDPATHYSNVRELGLALARAGQHQRAGEVVKQLGAMAENGEQWVNIARILALCTAAAANDAALSPADRSLLTDDYAGAALSILNKAAERGTLNKPDVLQNVKTNPEFDALRDREEFRKLLEGL